MGVGLFKPHLPFNSPKKYWDLYERENIPISPNPRLPENVHWESLHNSGEFNQYALGDELPNLAEPVSEPYAKKIRHAYLASVSYIDAQIGRLYQELITLGLDKNTIVIIWGDHGWHLGDQRVWGKHTLFENALKSALIIKSPYARHKPRKVDEIVETVDLYPTLLDLCGIKIKHQLDGESLAGLMESRDVPTMNTAYGYFKKGISLRTPDYRLTKYYREEEPVIELYDHTADPLESSNVAEKRPEIVAELMPLLEKGNTGLYSD
jgi:arylsulfatase A-like enzyme